MQDQKERDWIDSHIPRSFRYTETKCWKMLCNRFGPTLCQNQLVDLANMLSDLATDGTAQGGPLRLRQRLERTIKRRKSVLIWWFEQNWEISEPLQQQRIEVHLEDGATLWFSNLGTNLVQSSLPTAV
jgi:hypothetical protein